MIQLITRKHINVLLINVRNKSVGTFVTQKGITMKIDYLMHCGSDDTIANTARVSMEEEGNWLELPENYTVPQRDKLIKYLATHKHTSPFRHNNISVRCLVPIFLARQLGKHQVGLSWNEVSRRYVDTVPTFYTPTEWRSRPNGSIKQGSGESAVLYCNHEFWGDEPTSYMYSELIDHALAVYNSMLKAGVAPEMARMVLPQSMNTEFVWSGSLMAFAHIYKLRIDGHSQLEAQQFARQLDTIIRPLFPVAWEALVGEVK
jgi:thymidylate synthase (FAD)